MLDRLHIFGKRIACLGCAVVFPLISGIDSHAETLTYGNLVDRMTQLDRLAELPPNGEKTALASSYDRSSRYDATTDKYIGWDANDDGVGFVRKEGNSTVMADIQGSGCIWRTWSATINRGACQNLSGWPADARGGSATLGTVSLSKGDHVWLGLHQARPRALEAPQASRGYQTTKMGGATMVVSPPDSSVPSDWSSDSTRPSLNVTVSRPTGVFM